MVVVGTIQVMDARFVNLTNAALYSERSLHLCKTSTLTLRAFASIPRGNMLNGVAELERILPLRCMAENTRKRCAICLPSDIPSVLLILSGFTARNIAGNKQRLYGIILVSFPRFTARKRGICPQCLVFRVDKVSLRRSIPRAFNRSLPKAC